MIRRLSNGQIVASFGTGRLVCKTSNGSPLRLVTARDIVIYKSDKKRSEKCGS